ncbi:MAG: hypothetical protein F6K58_11270 [Symploca sp. SIO2E9]|nr:hypothetical protein [Symploca sp. SIO2E9]
MKAVEIIRIIILSFIGVLIMFVGQSFLFDSGLIPLDVDNISGWLGTDYMPGAVLVFIISVFSTILWCVMTVKARDNRGNEVSRWSLFWWLIGLLPILSIGLAIGFFNTSDSANLPLTILFLFDVLLLFWLTTATSTPGTFMYIPPGSFFIRNLIERDRE